MLDHRLQLIQRLVHLRFPGLKRLHFRKEGRKLLVQRLRKLAEQAVQGLLFRLFVRLRLFKGGDVSCHRLAQVVDQTHADDLIDIHIRKLVLQKICHERRAPAMGGHIFRHAVRGDAVAGN